MSTATLEQHPTWLAATRALRRGELRDAVALFEQLKKEFPHHPAPQARLLALRESLLPSELTAAPETAAPDPSTLSPLERAEFYVSSGDVEQAAQLYRQAVASSPGNALLEERLREVAAMEPVERARPAPRPVADPKAQLSALLARLAARRRP